MKPDAYMRFFGNDFEAATKGWSRSDRWSYLAAIWHYRSHTHCAGLPDDDDFLRRICECDPQEWQRVKGRIFDNGRFFKLIDGKWHQNRAARDYQEDVDNYDAQCRRTAKATAARLSAVNVAKDVTSNATSIATRTQPEPEPEPEPTLEQEPYDKASVATSKTGKPTKPTKSKKLTERMKEVADSLEVSLGQEWRNDAGKWVGRIKSNPGKSERVAAEVANAIKEARIDTTPAAYAEDTWKRFA